MSPRLGLVYQSDAPFIATDAEILSARYRVQLLKYRRKADFLRLARRLVHCDIVVSWFALGHSTATVFLSRLFGTPSAVIVGGWDVAAMPEVPYGAMLSAGRRRKTSWTLRHADLVVAPSRASRDETTRWVHRDVRIIPLGVDTEFFRPSGSKQNLVATAVSVTHNAVIRTKGLDVLFEVARNLPGTSFAVAGRQSREVEADLRRLAPPNLQFVGWLDHDRLRDLFQRAAVYAQFSAHESFGLAAAEAMASGCVPVVSDRGALPELVGDAGVIVPYGDVAESTEAIEGAVAGQAATTARQRIESLFSMRRRRELLLQAMGELA